MRPPSHSLRRKGPFHCSSRGLGVVQPRRNTLRHSLSNWTGKALSGPRTEFEGVLAREESDKSGIYFLTGTDPETGSPQSISVKLSAFVTASRITTTRISGTKSLSS